MLQNCINKLILTFRSSVFLNHDKKNAEDQIDGGGDHHQQNVLHRQLQQENVRRRIRLTVYVLILVFLFYVIYHSAFSNENRVPENRDGKPSSQEAKQNLERDLHEVALEVQNGGVPFENMYHQEDFFVVWNRVFNLAADVSPVVVEGEYRNVADPKDQEQFFHHFKFLFRSGNPKHYKPLHPAYQFVPIVNRFLVGETRNQQDDAANDFHDPSKPFVVFIRSSEIMYFYSHLQWVIQDAQNEIKNFNFLRKFILVTAWTDPGPSAFLHSQELLKSPYIVKWWAQNCDLTHLADVGSKMECLPIGVDYHTVAHNARWGLKTMTPAKQADRMREIANDELGFYLNFKLAAQVKQNGIATHMFTDRSNKILMDFAIASNVGERLKTWLQVAFLSPLCMSPLTRTGNWLPVPRDDIWRNYLHYRFVLSPPGNGYECHRTYEALILGAIPIMKLHPKKELRPAIERLYEDLPVIFVEDFTCEYINSEAMEKWNEFGAKFWSNQEKVDKMRKKLLNRYWVEKIRGTVLG